MLSRQDSLKIFKIIFFPSKMRLFTVGEHDRILMNVHMCVQAIIFFI